MKIRPLHSYLKYFVVRYFVLFTMSIFYIMGALQSFDILILSKIGEGMITEIIRYFYYFMVCITGILIVFENLGEIHQMELSEKKDSNKIITENNMEKKVNKKVRLIIAIVFMAIIMIISIFLSQNPKFAGK